MCENSNMNRAAYTFLLYVLLPFTPLKLLWRGRKQPEYLQHWRERYGFYTLTPKKPVIWLHCVSVGETRAAAPLIKALIAQYPNYQILLTHTTPTGRATSEQLYGEHVSKVYLPYDLPFAVNNFLKHFQPTFGVLMETELWFNLISACQQHHTPLFLVNARLSEKSALGYAKISQLMHEGLQSLTAIAAQTEQDAQRLQNLGGNNIKVTGNLKFDVQPPKDSLAKGRELRALLGLQRNVLLAASTREGEEEILLDAVALLNIKNLLLVIVPRHPERFNTVALILKNRGLIYEKRSQMTQALDQNMQYVLGDTMGELFSYYAACDIAFIGGSLLPFGGQNLIEATSVGKPVLIGPHNYNFAEATKQGIAAGAVIQVQNIEELSEKIEYLFSNTPMQQQMSEASFRFSQASTGATAKVMQIINQNLTK